VCTEQQMGLSVIGTCTGVGPTVLLDVLWFLQAYWMFCGSFSVIGKSVGSTVLLNVLWVLPCY